MSRNPLSPARCAEASTFVASTLGLHFPPDRWGDLQRGLTAASRALDFVNPEDYLAWLLSSAPGRKELHALATHLTVGETYFLREPKTFEVISNTILPSVIRARRGTSQRLRIWSAACCTGEEAYSLAIMIHRLLPDLADWHVTIIGSDVNPQFLQRAETGSFGPWSFRDVPPSIIARYFDESAGGRRIVREDIRRMVSFQELNLVEDAYPSLASGINAMDLIFCRNVLMYFTPDHARAVAERLHRVLAPEGVLAVGSSEGSLELFSQFSATHYPGAFLYHKGSTQNVNTPAIQRYGTIPKEAHSIAGPMAWVVDQAVTLKSVPTNHTPTESVKQAEVHTTGDEAANAASAHLRSLANEGRLTEALAFCEERISTSKLDPTLHYLRAVVLLELGDIPRAQQSLHHTLYLDPNFVLAHFTLGNIARQLNGDAHRHFAHALQLLRACQPTEVIPESEGLTANRLEEIITSVSGMSIR